MADCYTSSGTTTAWGSWNVIYYTSAGATSCDTWIDWNQTAYCNSTVYVITSGTGGNYAVGPATVETDAEREERAERLRTYEANRAQAEEAAAKLLAETLSASQRVEMAKERYFTVESQHSKRRYRVRTNQGRHGNIEELDAKGRVVATLCCAPSGLIPVADALLGQKLALEGDEEEFLKYANRTPRRVA